MKRIIGPFGPLMPLLLLALAMTGIAYGLWAETLTIDGTVNTATLSGRWSGVICSDFYDWPWPPEGTGEVEGKDVGSTTAVVDQADPSMLAIVVRNGYPSYASDCQVEFTNDGTMPFKIRGTALVPVTGLTNCTVTGAQSKTLACDQLTVELIDGIGSQIEPGEMVAMSFRVHVEQTAEMDTSYRFSAGVCLGQWNEPATSEACFAAAP